VIPPGALVLLDTNVVVELARNRALGQRINRDFGLQDRPERPLISVVTVGEVHGLADYWRWGPDKVTGLVNLLQQLLVVGLRQGDIVHRYASISAHCTRSGLAVGDNDRWIAATASAAGATLLTSDRDFDPLHPEFVNRVWIDPSP
jgi:tRNA(fMet)-specific endonuclease VapC